MNQFAQFFLLFLSMTPVFSQDVLGYTVNGSIIKVFDKDGKPNYMCALRMDADAPFINDGAIGKKSQTVVIVHDVKSQFVCAFLPSVESSISDEKTKCVRFNMGEEFLKETEVVFTIQQGGDMQSKSVFMRDFKVETLKDLSSEFTPK